MDAEYTAYIGLALFVASELIGMSKYKSNSIVQLLLTAALRAFPYAPKKREPGNPLDIFKR
jgi:hypothetical protein